MIAYMFAELARLGSSAEACDPVIAALHRALTKVLDHGICAAREVADGSSAAGRSSDADNAVIKLARIQDGSTRPIVRLRGNAVRGVHLAGRRRVAGRALRGLPRGSERADDAAASFEDQRIVSLAARSILALSSAYPCLRSL